MFNHKISMLLCTVMATIFLFSSSVSLTNAEVIIATNNQTELKQVANSAKYVKPVINEKKWKKVNGKYKYPIDTNTKEWAKYDNHIEMMEACSVPQKILDDASTEQLLELVLEYPLLCDIFAYDSNEQGMMMLTSQFNGLGELLQRENLPEVVFNAYMEQDIQDATNDNQENFLEVSEIVVLESLLAQKEVVNHLSPKQKTQLSNRVQQNVEKKQRNELFKDNLSTFYEIAEKNGVADKINLRTVAQDAKADVNANKKYYVKTPKGTKVEVLKYTYKGDKWADALDKEYKKSYPSAKLLRSSDNRYNCHSYAWYSQSKDNRYWMNSPKSYVNDGSYKYVGKGATASNQKVVYKYQVVPMDNWIHSGITVDTSGMIKSKWGQAPLMQHKLGYCPYFGQYNVLHFYKKA